jgi:hypothetical protein
MQEKKYQQGTELGYNNIDQSYSGSMSTRDGELLNEEPPALRSGWVCPQCYASVAPHNDICPECQTVKTNESRINEGKQILNG